ncbi:hypothetical protein JHK84_031294 [Glycine max]|nr:hypothetical protein JHK86_031165 [Glycine max]KAG5145751.1 hypothetical protein JHK84_031294 [Glycine max]
MVSTRSSLKCETPLESSNPPPTTMIDNNTLQQLQTRITEMEQCHEEKLQKLKIRNLNPEVALHSMLLVLRPGKFADSLCKQKASQQHGRVTRTSQRLHPNGGDVKVQKRGPTGRTEAGQKRRTHQDRLTQVRQKAQAR